MTVREAFEKWVSGRSVVKKYGAKLTANSDGSYRDYRINDRWLAYQAGYKDATETMKEDARECLRSEALFVTRGMA